MRRGDMRTVAAAAVLAAGLGVAGCGGSSGPRTTTTTGTLVVTLSSDFASAVTAIAPAGARGAVVTFPVRQTYGGGGVPPVLTLGGGLTIRVGSRSVTVDDIAGDGFTLHGTVHAGVSTTVDLVRLASPSLAGGDGQRVAASDVESGITVTLEPAAATLLGAPADTELGTAVLTLHR